MPPRQPRRPRFASLALALGLLLGALSSPVARAAPSLAQEEQQGGSIAASVRSGERSCADLSADEFELIGEFVMGRYLGDEAAHAAMNTRMTVMLGAAGERRMHTALGYRYSGCAAPAGLSWVGAMAGMMGGGAGGPRTGMMGGAGQEEGGHYSGAMGFGHHDNGDVSTVGIILIALAAAALAGGLALLWQRRGSPPQGA